MRWLDQIDPTLSDPTSAVMEANFITPENLERLAKAHNLTLTKDKDGEFLTIPSEFAKDPSKYTQFIDYWIGSGPEESDRMDRYRSYAIMDRMMAEAMIALDTYADEAVGLGFVDNPLEISIVYGGDDKSDLEDKILKILKTNRFFQSTRSHIRNLVKFGDLGFRI